MRSAVTQGGFGLLGDSAESFRIVNRDVGQHFAVDLHLGAIHSIDQAAVRKPVQTRSSINPGDPERPELALALPTIPIRVLARLDDSLLRGLE
jgi:hypothetical protein